MEISSFPLSPYQVYLQHSTPSAVSFQFFVYSVFCFVLFLVGWGSQPAQGVLLVYPRGGWGNTT
jgi:hypothetical protein